MIRYKFLLLILILPFILVACAGTNISGLEGGTTEIETPPSQTPEPSLPNNENSENENKPPVVQSPLIPLNPSQSFDRLIEIKATSLVLYSNKKVVGTVYKNDLLPLIDETSNYYITTFNYNPVYIEKNGQVGIKKLPKSSSKIEKVIETAKKTIGTKYVYGAERYHYNGKRNYNFNKLYFDCSSLTQYAYFVGANVVIGANSRIQSTEGKVIKKSNISRGDLLFFTNSSRQNNTGIERVGHVGIYLGDNLMLHTASDYAIIEPISSKRWSYYISARRYV